MSLIGVNRHACTRDGICAEVCPIKLIRFEETGYPTPIPEAEKLKWSWGRCQLCQPTWHNYLKIHTLV